MLPVPLSQLRVFLQSQDWQLIAAPDEFVEVWRFEGLERGDLILPTEEAIDKPFLVEAALAKLADLNEVPIHELTQLVRDFFDNTISIRVKHQDVSDGSIPLEDGISLNTNAKELLTAAANAALARRPNYQGRLAAPVQSLIQNARLGQTTHGSYVIHVFCKDQPNEPVGFASATTRTLHSALSGLREAVDSYSESADPLAFEEALSRGASANLCDAIARFSGKERSRTVEISLQPSQHTLAPAHRATIVFEPHFQPAIKAAADYYRQTYTLHDETVIGVIERLDRRATDEEGEIRIAATLSNGISRSVSLHLSRDDYEQAIHAHENKGFVRATGDVVVTPRTAHIVEPRNFAIIGNLDLFKGNT